MLANGGRIFFETPTKVATLSTSTERFAYVIWFIDSETAANQTDGIYFLYDEGGVSTGSSASANWQCVTVNNSTRTFTTTSVAVWADTRYRLTIEVNAGGTSVGFFIDWVSVATHTTNIPTASGREFGFWHLIIKSIGTTARTAQIDYYNVIKEFTTQR